MPSEHAGFSFIDQYHHLSKQVMEEESAHCSDLLSLDQEVPQMRAYLEAGDTVCSTSDIIKAEPMEASIKMEPMEPSPADPFMEVMLTSATTSTVNSNSVVPESRIPSVVTSPSFPNFFSSRSDNHSSAPYIPRSASVQYSGVSSTFTSSKYPISSVSSSQFTPLSSTAAAAAAAASSSSQSPMLSSTAFTSSPSLKSSLNTSSISDIPLNDSSNSSVRMSSYVTELGGSGCVVMTHGQSRITTETIKYGDLSDSMCPENFLICQTPPHVASEEGLDYLDLDRQPSALYADLKVTGVKVEQQSQMDSTALMEAALMMRDVIHHDCDTLKVPYDPSMWTAEHVWTWISWVCQRNNLQGVTSSMHWNMDGNTLCSLKVADFRTQFGQAGDCICTELELWKAANSCFPENEFSSSLPAQQPQNVPHHSVPSHLEGQVPYTVTGQLGQTRSTPCVSPAPSSDSGHSGSQGIVPSDSDEEYSSGDSSTHFVTGSNKVGRGHKQTIYLWQFLRELLLSRDNGHSDCIRWIDRKSGIFKIEDSKKVALLWGKRKNRPAMNYDKLSRSMRQYYKKKIIKKTEQSKRLVYQFCPGHF